MVSLRSIRCGMQLLLPLRSRVLAAALLSSSCGSILALGCATSDTVVLVQGGDAGANGASAHNDLVVFTTKETFRGDLGGVSGADEKCNTYAKASGLKGTFRAWLSDLRTDAISRVPDGAGPWRILEEGQVQGEIAFADRDGWTGYPKVRLDHNEFGKGPAVGSIPYTWTGTKLGGKGAGCRCMGWTTAANFVGGCTEGYGGQIGSRTALEDDDWTDVSENPCDAPSSLLCFQVP